MDMRKVTVQQGFGGAGWLCRLCWQHARMATVKFLCLLHYLPEVIRGQDLHAFDHLSLPYIGTGDADRLLAGFLGGQHHRQDACRGQDLPIEADFSRKEDSLQASLRNAAISSQHGKGDGQVKARPCFAYIGWIEVDG